MQDRHTGVAVRFLARWRAGAQERPPAAATAPPRPAPPPRRPPIAAPPPGPRPVARVGMVSVPADADGVARLRGVLARADLPRCVIVELRGAPADVRGLCRTVETAPTRIVVVVDDRATRAALAGVPGVHVTTSRTAAMEVAGRAGLVSYRTLAA